MVLLLRSGLRFVPATLCLWLAFTLQVRAWADVDGPAAGAPESIGRYAAGCVIGAARLPPEGPGYQAIRLQRNRHYGHPELVLAPHVDDQREELPLEADDGILTLGCTHRFA